MMQEYLYPKENEWEQLCKRPVIDNSELEPTVLSIMNDVKANGDKALKAYNLKFDNASVDNLLVSENEINEVDKKVDSKLKTAIKQAYENIYRFHSEQKESSKVIETTEGVKCWRRSVAIEKIGLYIPGGTAPLFSTVLMLAAPAKIAKCKEIILCTPPNAEGKINDAILFAAKLTGITKIFKVGGAQAIAAMTFGTESVPKVYKIFGPGNQYVTCAKQLAAKMGTAIDMPAGPSELLVYADETCMPAFVAADLLSQAEHGTDSQVILVTTKKDIVESVLKEIKKQLDQLPRKNIAERALKNSKIILLNSESESIDLINEYAPEHLILACKNDEDLAENIINAGSVFLGNYAPESAGDYASGTNHTLPTNGYAKAFSGVSLDSFIKKITFQKISQKGIKTLASTIETMAQAEGLFAHKNAVTIRTK